MAPKTKKRHQINSSAQFVVYTTNGSPLPDEIYEQVNTALDLIVKENKEARLLLTSVRA